MKNNVYFYQGLYKIKKIDENNKSALFLFHRDLGKKPSAKFEALEDGKEWKKGDIVVIPLRFAWRHHRDDYHDTR